MTLKTKPLSTAVGLILITLGVTACGSSTSKEDRNAFQEAQPTSLIGANAFATSGSTIVHVDKFARVATIRINSDATFTFAETKNRPGKITSTLKAIPDAESTTLLAAEILDGVPEIGNTVHPVSESKAKTLAKKYSDISQ